MGSCLGWYLDLRLAILDLVARLVRRASVGLALRISRRRTFGSDDQCHFREPRRRGNGEAIPEVNERPECFGSGRREKVGITAIGVELAKNSTVFWLAEFAIFGDEHIAKGDVNRFAKSLVFDVYANPTHQDP